MANDRKERLRTHEWMTVLSFISMLLFLVTITWCQEEYDPNLLDPPHHLIEPVIVVSIDGAVENPGVYTLPRGAIMADLIQKAVVTERANTSKIVLNKKLRSGQIIEIPPQEYVTITLTGEVVSPGEFIVLKESKAEDLWEKIEFKPTANINRLPRKRRFRNGETIHIPIKKMKKTRKTR